MSRTQEEQSLEEKQDLVDLISKKKSGLIDKDWSEICQEFGLNLNTETQRKAGVGIKLAFDANMIQDPLSPTINALSGNYVERQKMRDQTGKINKIYRAEARSELLRETIAEAIKTLPAVKPHRGSQVCTKNAEKQLVLALGDFHYGADICIEGLNGEILNEFNHGVFEERMGRLLGETIDIIQKEDIRHVHVFLVGDLLDGMLRQTQLMRLEYGQVESTMRLSEYLAFWLNEQANYCGRVEVYAASGNHSEIRPLNSKKREFSDENMERVILWYLAERLRGSKHIIVHDECKKYVKADVCGFSFLLLHGDSEKNIQDLATETIRQYGQSIDFFVCGHKHRESEYPSGMAPSGDSAIIRVPSLCGTDSYAQSKGYTGRAGATIIIMENGYGRRCVYPIRLQ